MEIYVQETTALLYLKKISTTSRQKVLDVAIFFPVLLARSRKLKDAKVPARIFFPTPPRRPLEELGMMDVAISCEQTSCLCNFLDNGEKSAPESLYIYICPYCQHVYVHTCVQTRHMYM